MSEEVASKFSVSFPTPLRRAVDAYLAKLSAKKARSEYLAELAERDLREKGEFQPDPIHAELLRTRELISARGLDVVRAKHDEIVQESIAAEGAA